MQRHLATLLDESRGSGDRARVTATGGHTRRAFLERATRATLAGLVSAGVLPARADAAGEQSAEPRWQIGCYTRPWGQYDYRVAMDAIAEAGFKYVGLMSTKPKDNAKWALVITVDTPLDEARQVGVEAAQRGLQIPSVYGGRIPVHRSLAEGIAGLKKLIDNCAAAKAKSLLLGGINREALVEPYYKAVAECCDYAVEHGVAFALKPHGPLNATGPECRRAIERVGHKNLTLWYDPGNILFYSDGKIDPVDHAATVRGLVTGMCVKDYRQPDDVRVTPGTGQVDFPALLARLQQGGFTGGPLVIETLAPGDPDVLVKEAKRARKFVENLVADTEPGN